MLKAAKNILIFVVMIGILFSNIPYMALKSGADFVNDYFNVIDKFYLAQGDRNVVDRFLPFGDVAKKFEIPEAKAATSGQVKFYFHKEPSDKNETYNALSLTPPEPAAETASGTTSTTTFNPAAPAICESSNNTGETYNKVSAANNLTAAERCMASFISSPVGQSITISNGDTPVPTANLWIVDSGNPVVANTYIYLYKWDGTNLSSIVTFTSTTDPSTTVTSAAFTAGSITTQTLSATDRIVAIVTRKFTSTGSGNSSILFDSSARTPNANISLDYTVTTPNKPSLVGTKNDDFTTGAATTACSTSGVAYNTKWRCLKGNAGSTSGYFNAGNSAGTTGDTSSWLWLSSKTNSILATPSNFGTTPSNTFLYQSLNAGYGDGVVRTVVNSTMAYTVGSSSPSSPYSHTGIVLWASNTDYLEVQVYSTGAKGAANTTKVALNTSGSLGTAVNLNSTVSSGFYNRVWIGFSKTGNNYQAQYSTDGSTWNNLGSAVAHATAFTRTGLNAFTRLASPITTYAGAFDWFQYTFGDPVITVGTSGTQTPTVLSPVNNKYMGGAFTMIRGTNSANVTSIRISETGTVNANANLSNVKLLYDTTNCTYDGTEPQYGSTTTFNTSNQATFTGSVPVGTSQVCFYAVMNVGAGASSGETIDFQITNPSTEVVVSAGTVTPATAVAIPGSSTIAKGTLGVDMVNGSGGSIGSPSIGFPSAVFSWGGQQRAATLGISSQKIRVANTTGIPAWTMSMAASGGNASLWQSGSNNYDFNGSAAAGRLQVDASGSTITPQSGCGTTGLVKGSASYFAQGSQDSINLLSAGSSADVNCYWDLTGVDLIQDIPPAQMPGNYSITMSLTVM